MGVSLGDYSVGQLMCKAKGKDGEGWREGYYWQTQDTVYCVKEDYEASPDSTHHYILFDGFADWGMPKPKYKMDIDPTTLCRNTGLLDRKARFIWENDIVEIKYTDENGPDVAEEAVVQWVNGRLELHRLSGDTAEDIWRYIKGCEVIGNIIDGKDRQ